MTSNQIAVEDLLKKIDDLSQEVKFLKCSKASSQKERLNFPKRIILIRHGESQGNKDESVYSTLPDWRVPLTDLGYEQSVNAGKSIKELIGDEPISIYCSPYIRTKQTLHGIMSQLDRNHIVNAREEPRLTEQQFGNFQRNEDMQVYKTERSEFGRFYYRFPQGEAGLDVYDRVSLFIGTLFREWDKHHESTTASNVLIVTHGLTLRLFLMRWYQYTVEEFERTSNPGNAQTIVMTRKDNQQYAGDPTYILEPAGRVALGLALSKTDRHYMHQRRSLPRGHQDAIPEEEDTGATSPQGRTPRRDLSMVLEGICAPQKPDVAADTKNSDK